MSKPKSTGYRSQHSHAFGHAASIAEQMLTVDLRVTARQVLYAMIGELVEDGEWPEVMHPWLRPGPLPWSEADSRLANVMVEKMHAFADLHGLSLVEYIDGVPTKVTYGGAKP